MLKKNKYLKPRIEQAVSDFHHFLDEATLLAEALILQQAGSSLEKYKNLDVKKASIDSLNAVLYTLKSIIKDKLHFLHETIDDEREFNLKKIAENEDLAKIISLAMKLNLISDNNDISLYLAPYIERWDLLTSSVRTIIINQVIKNINAEIERAHFSEKIAKKY